MRVFSVLVYDDYEEARVHSVWSSRDLAENACAQRLQNLRGRSYGFIAEHELDSPVDNDNGDEEPICFNEIPERKVQ